MQLAKKQAEEATALAKKQAEEAAAKAKAAERISRCELAKEKADARSQSGRQNCGS